MANMHNAANTSVMALMCSKLSIVSLPVLFFWSQPANHSKVTQPLPQKNATESRGTLHSLPPPCQCVGHHNHDKPEPPVNWSTLLIINFPAFRPTLNTNFCPYKLSAQCTRG